MKLVHGNNEVEPFVDRKEMARQLGISLRLLDQMVSNQEIPSVTWGRRTRRFKASVVIAHLAHAERRLQNRSAA